MAELLFDCIHCGHKLAVMWRLLINHIRNGHVSLPYHVNMPALGFTLTLVFNARVIH